MWCSIGRGRKLRRVAGRRDARRRRIAASSPTRCPGDARGVPRVRIPSRARPRGHLPGAHRAKPRRFFASPNSIWRRLGGRTFAVQRVGRLISPLCVPAAITRGCAGVVARRREVQTRSRAALSARVSGCLTRRFERWPKSQPRVQILFRVVPRETSAGLLIWPDSLLTAKLSNF